MAPRPDLGYWASTRAGRLGTSAILVVTLTSLIAWNLPRSALRDALLPPLLPWIRALALEQDWTIFSPDPSRLSVDLEARVRFADDSEEAFRLPHCGPWLGELRCYRWHKWARRVRLDHMQRHWEPTARFVARTFGSDERRVSSVTLVRRWAYSPAPGSGRVHAWREHAFYTLTLAGESPGEN